MSIAEKLELIAENEQKVFEAGEKSNRNEFWNAYQDGGNRTNYQYAFAGNGWTAVTFRPEYDIRPTGPTLAIFMNCRCGGDLVSLLDSIGVELDFSGSTSLQMAFQSCLFNRIGVVDARSVTSMAQCFAYTSSLETIDKLIVSETTPFVASTFQSLSGLKNLTIEGTIGVNGFNIQWSTGLTNDSLMSIINALADYSADTSGTDWLCTIGTTNKNKLTEQELAIAQNKGWRIA